MITIQKILITVILGVIAVALLIWFFGDFLDDKDKDKGRNSAPIVRTL